MPAIPVQVSASSVVRYMWSEGSASVAMVIRWLILQLPENLDNCSRMQLDPV
ncbi:hypothetical protein DPMN_165599 [Dreissena polymorpha]|uniref:Uncharacterized protein n=1 Tax=Dreissena polymorpha TaxID=45954 RepID=A0A9D4IUR4_DREPO|nr:hypothetical protein DPMN_165599 [Dreissena polymorpha]